MDFGVIGAGSFAAVVTPDYFFIRRNFRCIFHAAKKYVAVGKHPDIVVLIAFAGGVSPDDFAIFDEKHFVVIFANAKHRVLRKSVAGQIGRRDAIRPGSRGRFGFIRAHDWDVSGHEFVEHIHARSCRRGGRHSRRVTTC